MIYAPIPSSLRDCVSFLKKYARRGRLDVVSKAVERMAQEVLIKQERNAWSVVMKAVAEAATKDGRSDAASTSGALRHVLTSNNTGASAEFVLQDLNDLMTRMRRVNTSWAGGTPADYNAKGMTDLFVSPEVKGQIRKFAYNAIRTDSAATAANAQSLPDDARMAIYNAAGMESIYGVAIHELVELAHLHLPSQNRVRYGRVEKRLHHDALLGEQPRVAGHAQVLPRLVPDPAAGLVADAVVDVFGRCSPSCSRTRCS